MDTKKLKKKVLAWGLEATDAPLGHALEDRHYTAAKALGITAKEALVLEKGFMEDLGTSQHPLFQLGRRLRDEFVG